MASFFDAVTGAVRGLACTLLSGDEFIAGAVGRFSPGLGNLLYDRINAGRRLYGCDPAGDPEPPDPDFEGGQCQNVGYTVTISNGINTASRSGIGPVLGVCFGETTPTNRSQWGVSFGGGSTPGNCQLSGTGTATIPISTQGDTSIIDVGRNDGLPDDCGDPEPVYPEPIDRPINIDITFQPDFGPEVTVNIPFIFSPITANFDGSLNIPFKFDFGGFEFNGNFNVNPSIGPVIFPPRVPTGSGQGTEDLPEGDPEDEVPELPLDEKIIGVVVSSSIVGEQQLTTILTQSMPNILAPRAGSIKFAYSLGAATFWSNDIDVKGDRLFIPCPFSQGADAVVVSPSPGVEVEWVPIRGFPLATVADLR